MTATFTLHLGTLQCSSDNFANFVGAAHGGEAELHTKMTNGSAMRLSLFKPSNSSNPPCI